MLGAKVRSLFAVLLVALALGVGSAVLTPESAAHASPATHRQTIVGVAVSINAKTGEFSTLIAALKATGLVDPLSERGQYTVFAPTDAAFAKLGLNASNIGKLPKATLTNILLYHVAHGRRSAKSIVRAESVRMLNRKFVKVSTDDGAVFVNNARVIIPNVAASNGVIHVIDTVLMP